MTDYLRFIIINNLENKYVPIANQDTCLPYTTFNILVTRVLKL